MVLFRTFRGPLFPKPVTVQELFLAVSYSKPALALQRSLDIFQFTTDRMIEIQVMYSYLETSEDISRNLNANPQYQKNQMTKCW